MATKRDYYEILGVSKSATPEDMKRAYRKLALEWHPDRNKSPQANERFKEINEAYAVLSDLQKKAQYDQFGHAAFAPGRGGSGGQESPFGAGFGRQGPFTYTYSTGGSPFGGDFDGVDPFEIFEQFFGGGFNPRARRERRREVYQITIDFMDAVKGTTKEVHIPAGLAGDGSLKKTIKIPPGVDTGSRIRFDDFDIAIEVRADHRFQRQGDDLVSQLPISYPTAALGAVIDVPTIDGPVKIRIQPGTQPGTLIRLKGKGVPHVRGSGRGDQYVKVVVSVPTRLTKKQRDLLSDLQAVDV